MSVGRRLFRHPVYAAVLAVMWVILQQRVTVGDVVVGYVVATLVLYNARHLWTERVTVVRPLALLRLTVRFAWEIVAASVLVAWIVVRPRLRVQPVFLVLPLASRDDFVITALANMITLTPGTLTVDVAPDRSALYVHCLSAADADSVRRQITEQFAQPLQEAIRCSPL